MSVSGDPCNICRLCRRSIFLDSDPVHLNCHIEYRRQQAEQLSNVRVQFESILRNAFIAVNNILNKVTESLKWNLKTFASDADQSQAGSPQVANVRSRSLH